MNASWEWACKKFSSAEAEQKLSSGFYHIIRDEGSDKILGFKYVIEESNLPLPDGMSLVKNEDIIKMLDSTQNRRRR